MKIMIEVAHAAVAQQPIDDRPYLFTASSAAPAAKPYLHVDDNGMYIVGDGNDNEFATISQADANSAYAYYMADWERFNGEQ